MNKLQLHKITLNDFLEEDKELICESTVLSKLESYAEGYARDCNLEMSDNEPQWKLLGIPTMGDRKLNGDPKKILKISEKVFLLISVL